MIIKIIPETDAEKAKHKAIEFSGVREFFLVGNRRDDEGYMVDFHEWEGGYKYLLSSLHWFYKVIDEERADRANGNVIKATVGPNPTAIQVPTLIKRGEVNKPIIQILNPQPFPEEEAEQVKQPFFKAIPLGGNAPSDCNRGGDSFPNVVGDEFVDDPDVQNPEEEAFPEEEAQNLEQPKIGRVAEAGPIRFPKLPKPLKRPVVSKDQLDAAVRNVNKKFGGEMQAEAEEGE